MLYFFFILIIFAIVGLVFLSVHYKKLIKYLAEDSKVTTLEALVL